MISQLWTKLVQAVNRPPAKFALTNDAQRVLAEASARGYRVAEEIRQGSAVVMLEKEGSGSIHLWSSDDIVEFGRSKNWI
jgi:hypothetical protein